MRKVLAFDFGATSGRAIKATYSDGKINYEEIHRFDNVPVLDNDRLCWDTDMILRAIKTAIKKAGDIDSLAFDTWGVDYGILDEDGKLIALPTNYRDKRTQKSEEIIFSKITKEKLYSLTGNQIMPINTLFQLVVEENLKKAKTILFMPDLFNYLLTGEKVCEKTIASTSQLFDPIKKTFSSEIANMFGVDLSLFPKLVDCPSVTGEYNGIKVITVAGHDTQCAVGAIPCTENDVAFLSCGTWSLIGCETDEPILTEESLKNELSNEIGCNGKINYLQNICGLWLISSVKRALKARGENYSYDDLEQLARASKPLKSFIDPDDRAFTADCDIFKEINNYCLKTNQPAPETIGETVRLIYESLALKYRLAFQRIETVTGKKFATLHMLGGGTKDSFLCELTARSLGVNVVAGPTEATALGNIILQLVALKEIATIEQARKIIRTSESLKKFYFGKTTQWDEAFDKFKNIIEK